ncbi:MBL fold metallo-hydrolase [Methylobacterium gnaphalii]|uniref:MBL fold metallo-hydrolase n=1 Tax=Methylobacterium gnaphalii TaxID=1010610 RepID=A0A512JLK7_9HYPH|nr:MBL fold metallo-hydrolase [Methylobacterium gnaphalii]GEP10836.1 MBL fold metallo-hydrolase [Methylobacterium gnaphalii]GJD70786.1 hypothetical protein MMMDOFMJ_3739 [Methylobacterium gnaphalii]GLS50718.1 MBL fold metallo-hydrolase [Methylobacterium gnaphalii]
MSDGSKPLPGVLRWNLGDLTVTVLNDGWFQDSAENLVTGISPEEAVALQKSGYRPSDPRITLNAFLITGPGRRPLLIDAGYGPLAPVASLGRVAAALAATGVAPAEIDMVLVSHLHPDHIGGLLGEVGKARFPNATIALHADEAAHWLPDAALAGAPDGAKPYFENARKVISSYEGRVQEHRGGEVAPGIVAVPLPGHTPGHTGFRITSGSQSLLMWTDIVHLPAIQFAKPEAGVGFDVDGELARETRKRILAEVADTGTLIAGSHLEFPALGYVTRDGGGYRFVPELWVSGQQ